MNFSTTDPIRYQFFRPSAGTFKTGSGADTKDVGNTVQFTPEQIKFKTDKNDRGYEEFSVWFKQGENVLSMRHLAALQVLKYCGGSIQIQASPKDITLENGTKTTGTNLFVEGEQENPEYLIEKYDANGIELTDWRKTILQYVERLGMDWEAFEKGRWVSCDPASHRPIWTEGGVKAKPAMTAQFPATHDEQMNEEVGKMNAEPAETIDPEEPAEIPSPAQATIDQSQRKKKGGLMGRIFTDEV